jgi:hypothetical protein
MCREDMAVTRLKAESGCIAGSWYIWFFGDACTERSLREGCAIHMGEEGGQGGGKVM